MLTLPVVSIPTAEELTEQLAALVRRRGLPQIGEHTAIGRLACVRERLPLGADGALLYEALSAVLPQVAAKLRNPRRTQAALALLSLDGPLVRAAPASRRQAAANALGMRQAESFRRRHEKPLIADLSRALLTVEVAYRHRTREPDLSRIDWLGRFEAYYRLYTPISGLRGDLLILLAAQREKPGEFDYLVAQLGSSLWFYSRIQLALAAFVRDYGGLWLLSDPEIETDVANAVQQINRNADLTEHDQSWLRMTLSDSADEELDPFLERVANEERGQAILKDWVAWCQSCRCPPGPPQRECEIHAVIEACETYASVLDREIRQLGQPYRQELSRIPAEDITDLIKRFGAVR